MSGRGFVGWLTASQRRTVTAALSRLIPPGPDGEPGAAEAGVCDYIDATLDAFATDPPRVFAGGPFSGRRGGTPSYATFLPLTRLQDVAWRQRIDQWQQAYRDGLALLGDDFADRPPEDQEARLAAADTFTSMLYEHACEGM